MRTLSVLEMDAVSGGEATRIQNLGQCAVDTVTAGAAGAALGFALVPVTGGLSVKIGAFIGIAGAILGSEACIAGLN